MRLNVSFRRAAIASIAVVALSAGVAASQSSLGGAPRLNAPRTSEPTVAIDATLISKFQIFRREPSERDQRVGLDQRGAGARRNSLGGENPALSRRAGPAARFSMYAVPGNATLCQIIDAGDLGTGNTCTPVDVAAAQGLSVSLAGQDGGREVYGLVPDWVRSVELIGPAGEKVSADLSDNGYVAAVPDGTRVGRLVGGDQAVEFEVPGPS